jgi:hypothetical protein
VLINWRSFMGKEGILIATKALRDDEISEDDAPKVAAFLLDGFSFFYENPKSTVSIFFITTWNIIIDLSYLLLYLPARQRRVSRQACCIGVWSSHKKDYWVRLGVD